MNKCCLKNNSILALCNPDCIDFLLVRQITWCGLEL